MTNDEILMMADQWISDPTSLRVTNNDELLHFARAIESRTLTNQKARWYQAGMEAGLRQALDQLPDITQMIEPIGEIVEAHGLIAVSIPEMPPVGTKLYAAPPKREWVGLTEQEIAEVGKFTTEGEHMLPYSFACAIEAKLKEKNGG